MHDLNENRCGYRKTKVGWLPNDWDCAAFGQIARRVSKPVAVAKGEHYREIGLRSHGRGVFHKDPVLGADLGEKRVFRVQPEALVFNIVFAWEQAVAMTSEAEAGMIASHRFPMFVGRDGKAEATFLLRYFLTPRGKHELGLASPGGAGRNKTLGQEDLTRLPVPLPPLAEQRRIVEVLATWDAALRDVEALIAAQRRRKAGLMQQLLTAQTRLPGFAAKWRPTKLGEMAEVNPRTAPPDSPSDACFVAMSDVSESGDLLSYRVHPYGELGGKGYTPFQRGDALVAKITPCFENGKGLFPAVLPCKHGFGSTEFHVLRNRPSSDAAFIYFLATSHEFRGRGEANMIGSAGQKRVPSSFIVGYPLKAPSLPEQRAIAAVLGSADDELRALEEKRAALERQKRALTQQLLSGALRVSPGQGPDSYSAQPERLGSGTERGS